MTGKESILRHLKKSSDHHAAMAETEQKICKAHGAIAESHTNAVLAQHHRDLGDHHGAKAQHHTARSKHFLELHQGLSGISPELLDEHSDAGDELRSSAGLNGFLKRVGAIAD
jgi:hypothetical protein